MNKDKTEVNNKHIYSFLLSFFLFSLLNVLQGQQLPVYSQYMLNSFLLNPAVAGHEGYTAVNLTAREQWLGLPDAPKTYALSGQTRLLKNSYIMRNATIRKRQRMQSRSGKVGMGVYIFNDKRGIFNNFGVHYTYAYHLNFRRSQLSFGGAVSMYQFVIDLTDPDLNVQNLQVEKTKQVIPDASFGTYFSNRQIYAGLSVLQLFQNQIQFSSASEEYKVRRQIYAMSGYRFDLIDFVFIEPSFLYKTNFSTGSQIDLNLKFYFKEDYWAGISYRTGGSLQYDPVFDSQRGSAIIVMGGVRVDKYFFGYSFDYNLSSISRYTLGSHELMLAAKFGDNARRYRWLNRY